MKQNTAKRKSKYIVNTACALALALALVFAAACDTGSGAAPDNSGGKGDAQSAVESGMANSDGAIEAESGAAPDVSEAEEDTPDPPPKPENADTDRERLVQASYEYLGIPYVWGGKTKEGGLDCSGFTKLVFAGAGVDLPDGSFNQAEGAKPFTSEKDLVPGDMLFYKFAGKEAIGHVTMYLGDGWVVGTGTPGEAHEVCIYQISREYKLMSDGTEITWRHINLPDEAGA